MARIKSIYYRNVTKLCNFIKYIKEIFAVACQQYKKNTYVNVRIAIKVIYCATICATTITLWLKCYIGAWLCCSFPFKMSALSRHGWEQNASFSF